MIYVGLVIVGFVLGYVCCMHDVERNIQRWKKGDELISNQKLVDRKIR